MDSTDVKIEEEGDDFIDVEEMDNEPGPSSRPQRSSARRISSISLSCQYCEFVATVQAEMNYHMRIDHPKEYKKDSALPDAGNVQTGQGRKRGRPRKYGSDGEELPKPITTKQLIGVRTRRNSVGFEKYVAKDETEVAPRIAELRRQGVVSSDTILGDFLHEKTIESIQEQERRQNEEMNDNFLECDEDMEDDIENRRRIVSENVNDYRVDVRSIGENKKRFTRRVGAPRKPRSFGPKVYDPKNIPFRLRVGDNNGKYECYVQECDWRGPYRSLRMEHMRAMHPDWKMPSRFLLQRISKDGLYIDPQDYVPPIPCLIEGCEWRGNFRASRSAHMRSCHPDEHAQMKKKREQGSHQPSGPYLCHLPECEWRGSSRSTRAKHMKQEHPTWNLASSKKMPVFECFACGSQLAMYSALVNHIHHNHGLGLMVVNTFETREEFFDWIATIERIYHIEFVRRSTVRQGPDLLKFQLICSCSSIASSKSMKTVTNLRNAAYSMGFLRKRADRIMTRRKMDCCLYLDVKEESRIGRFTVVGCIEHTGHYWGTPLIRPSILDRQVYQLFMNWRNSHNIQMPMQLLLDTLNETEGFRIDNLVPDNLPTEAQIFDDDDLSSLFHCIKEDSMKKNIFSSAEWETESLDGQKKREFGIGYMCPKMKELWQNYGAGGMAIIERTVLPLENYNITIFYVIVYTENILPRCCCLYVTTDVERGHREILSILERSDSKVPRTLVVDPSQVWVTESPKAFGSEPVDLQISEWTLLDYWAMMVERMIEGDMDQFYLMCALRRLLRVSDYQQFLCFIVELFESLFELEYHEFAKFFDTQLSDIAFFKRWSPLHRSELTSHNNPTFSLSVRYFRERFLNPCGITRVDEYFAHIIQRTDNFNSLVCSETYTLRPLDPIRRVIYPSSGTLHEIEKDSLPVGLGRLPRPAVSYQDEYEPMMEHDGMEPVYHELDVGATEEVDGGMHSVVDEEVILDEKGNEIVDVVDDMIGENVKRNTIIVVDEIVGMDDTIIEHEEIVGDLSVGHNVIVEDVPTSSRDYGMHESMYMNGKDFEEEIEEEVIDVGVNERYMEASSSSLPIRPKRETTKAVIGERRKIRPRIAESLNIDNLDDESLREIASQLIEIDGRKAPRQNPLARPPRLREPHPTVIEEETITEGY